METQLIETESGPSALELATLAFEQQPNDKTLQTLNKARDLNTVQQAQARKAKAEREQAERELKLARLAALREQLTTGLDSRLEARAQRIADKMLECLPIIQEWLDVDFEELNRAYFEADSLATELGQPKQVGAPPLNSLALRSSQIIQSKMPDNTDPRLLCAYAGSHWGV